MDDEQYGEHWSCRDLAKILDYKHWQKFQSVIDKAEKACENSAQAVSDHFNHVAKMVEIGSGAKRNVKDVYVSRYGAYLIVQTEYLQ